MAVTFRGSLATGYLSPTSDSYFLVIDVSSRSRCNLNLLSATMQVDTWNLATGANRIMPYIRVMKCTGTATGGIVATDKVAWDTTINSPDSGIRFRILPGIVSSDAITITGTPYTLWESFSARQTTGVRQFRSFDIDIYDHFSSSASVIVKPGELLILKWVEGDFAVGGTAFVTLAWEEDQTDAGFTLSGTATLSAVGVSGAKVVLVTDLDRDLPAPEVEIISTEADGTWSKTLATNVRASAFAQYRVGETLYTDEGKPYLSST